jgi:hypothetical protein
VRLKSKSIIDSTPTVSPVQFVVLSKAVIRWMMDDSLLTLHWVEGGQYTVNGITIERYKWNGVLWHVPGIIGRCMSYALSDMMNMHSQQPNKVVVLQHIRLSWPVRF